MEKSTLTKDGYLNGAHRPSLSSSSQRDVSYRVGIRLVDYGFSFEFSDQNNCGTCGYELNLSSSNRNTSTIGSKYGKSIKRGIISFFYIDDSRFTQVDEIQCIPHFSKHSWGLFRRQTKLLCRKCGNHIGLAYDDYTSTYPLVADGSDSSSGHEASKRRKYDIKIRGLQPLSSDGSGTPIIA
ncbi:hypothetical protein FNV43_RR12802 [Rhamnella rubrinervis]|uniref:Uncharacterized protein n=1 Tax=Rhamnella rubrinervis TaxID=2594499 RepID=A0A8K0H906_9ROSA|nr:hypothetical protein FNV43_RR12802 [Rhamnella rubrinervis]